LFCGRVRGFEGRLECELIDDTGLWEVDPTKSSARARIGGSCLCCLVLATIVNERHDNSHVPANTSARRGREHMALSPQRRLIVRIAEQHEVRRAARGQTSELRVDARGLVPLGRTYDGVVSKRVVHDRLNLRGVNSLHTEW
jgi:hypothetical protein